MTDGIVTRRASVLDARQIAELLNEIIQEGGTTAMTSQVTAGDIRDWIAPGKRNIWHVAEASSGEILGFQWIEEIPTLPAEATSIATFAKVGRTGLGIGSALFDATKASAGSLGFTWICANIRADNEGGLIYYQSRGFETYDTISNCVLDDGTIVDKILKRYDLT